MTNRSQLRTSMIGVHSPLGEFGHVNWRAAVAPRFDRQRHQASPGYSAVDIDWRALSGRLLLDFA